MYTLLIENVAKIQQAERLQEAERNRFSSSPGQRRSRIRAAHIILAISGIVVLVMQGL